MVVTRLAVPILLLSLAGCARLQTLRDPAAFIAKSRPNVVYVTHNNGALLTITEPRVSGDSLVGIWQGVAQPLALPLDQVKRVDAVHRDKTRTMLLVAGASVAAVGIGYMLMRGTADARQPCNFEGGQQFDGCDTDGFYGSP